MLVLTRRPGEEIVIDGTIRVTVVSVQGDRIRIGIVAAVHRRGSRRNPPHANGVRTKCRIRLPSYRPVARPETDSLVTGSTGADENAGKRVLVHLLKAVVVEEHARERTACIGEYHVGGGEIRIVAPAGSSRPGIADAEIHVVPVQVGAAIEDNR